MRRHLVKGTLALFLVGGASVAWAPAPAQADRGGGHCAAIDGPFTSVLVEPPQCTSPVALCTHGILHGSLEANYDFTALTLEPVDDPEHPGRLVYTGQSVITPIHGQSGQMFSDDTGYLDPDPSAPDAYFATTVHVLRGTRSETKTTANLVASGTLNFLTGEAAGSYSGTLCRNVD